MEGQLVAEERTHNPLCTSTDGVRSSERGGHEIHALSGGSLRPIYWLGTVIFNQSRTERCHAPVVSYTQSSEVLKLWSADP
ncbi:hypothetical protein TNCV_1264621 [Trichonephila clavipes]|nr:hypothetical protein TNCV_1264621 [Trichonephila clavipes]